MKALTEKELLERLRTRFSRVNGNGPRYVFTDHVKSGAGWSRAGFWAGNGCENRIIDGFLMALTLSDRLELTAFEIKSSRSDLLRELADPTKAAAFTDKIDKFVLVVGDKGIIRDGELPDSWGLMVPSGDGLRMKVQPSPLHDRPDTGRMVGGRPEPDYTLPPGFDRSFLAALLRSTARAAAPSSPERGEGQ